jgi:polysaccharide chain length determinant protein (PEP-CTERM system associated)
MLPGKQYKSDEILRIMWRSRWLIVLPVVIGLAGGLVASSRLALKYRSETLILVVPQRINDDYVKPTNDGTVADRVRTINDVIQSRSRLERIIQDLNLYTEQREQGAIMEDVVQRMRTDITVKVEGKEESFRVSYFSNNANTAQKVTDRLASLYIEENLRDQQDVAQGTNQFLESQLEDAKRRLSEQERKLEEYKRQHAGQLPTQQQANLQAIQNAQSQLQTVGESTNRARERRILIERQLADAQTLPVIPGTDVPTPPAPDTPPSLTPAQQLDAAKARLDVYKQRYTPDHPDIRSLERTIGDLQKKADEEARQPSKTVAKALTPAEAVRQRKVNELQAQLQAIDHQIAANQAEEIRLKGSIADYQAKVNAGPAREAELVALTRDYGTLSETYESLRKKYEDSKLAENLVRQQIGEQFKVIDAASLPEKPYNSMQRLAVLLAGPIVGLVLGLGFLGLREYRDSSFKTDEEVTRIVSMPVLAVVPLLVSERERHAARRRRIVLDFAGAAATLLVVAALVFWRLQS